jgi:hypothetical protein
MLVGDAQRPVTWTVPNEPNAVRRLVRRLERETRLILPGVGSAVKDLLSVGVADDGQRL